MFGLKKFLYMFRNESWGENALCIEKFIIKDETTLQLKSRYNFEIDCYPWTRPIAISKDRVLYCALHHSVLVIDGRSMKEIARIKPMVRDALPLHGISILGIAVSSKDELFIAIGADDVRYSIYSCHMDGSTSLLYRDEHPVPNGEALFSV